MSIPRGHNLSLSLPRRLMCDFLHLSRQVPLVAVERRMQLRQVVEARTALSQRPSWFALFMKAFGQVAVRHDALRRSYLSLPWPHLHQHGGNVASLPVERRIGDEDGVLFYQITRPEERPLTELDAMIRRVKTEPLETISAFRRQLMHGRMPGLLRRLTWWLGLQGGGDWRARYFGTFGVTGVASLGAPSLHLLTPLTTTLAYGVIGDDGSINVRLFYDHRVMDGVVPARAMEDLETTLCGSIRDELHRMNKVAA